MGHNQLGEQKYLKKPAKPCKTHLQTRQEQKYVPFSSFFQSTPQQNDLTSKTWLRSVAKERPRQKSAASAAAHNASPLEGSQWPQSQTKWEVDQLDVPIGSMGLVYLPIHLMHFNGKCT